VKVEQFVVTLHSEQPESMIAFYEHVVGLTPRNEVTRGAFMAGSSEFVALIIEGHSEVKGPATEPQRVLLNFVVDDLAREETRLKAHGVEFLRSATNEPGVGIFATFVDPDGNYCQLIEFCAAERALDVGQ
jgi:predicted enzyme related to lactoylglutathione lyase